MKIINVPDMRCEHCVKSITAALDKNGIQASVDLNTKSVKVPDDKVGAAAAVIRKAGFEVK